MTRTSLRMASAALGGAFAALLALAACTSSSATRPARRDDVNAPVAESGAQVPRSRIRDWSAPNDHTVIMVSDDGTRYRAETIGPCQGLDFANRVAFVNRGGFQQIDRFSSIELGDGTRCAFQSFDKLKAPESKALDDYEKASEGKPKADASGKPDDAKPK